MHTSGYVHEALNELGWTVLGTMATLVMEVEMQKGGTVGGVEGGTVGGGEGGSDGGSEGSGEGGDKGGGDGSGAQSFTICVCTFCELATIT